MTPGMARPVPERRSAAHRAPQTMRRDNELTVQFRGARRGHRRAAGLPGCQPRAARRRGPLCRDVSPGWAVGRATGRRPGWLPRRTPDDLELGKLDLDRRPAEVAGEAGRRRS